MRTSGRARLLDGDFTTNLLPTTAVLSWGRFDVRCNAFREGTRGATQEMQLFGRPWGFPLSEIGAPVHIWHGTEDVNVPVAIARRLAEEIPGAQAHVIEGGGHALSFDHGPSMMRQIVRAHLP